MTVNPRQLMILVDRSNKAKTLKLSEIYDNSINDHRLHQQHSTKKEVFH